MSHTTDIIEFEGHIPNGITFDVAIYGNHFTAGKSKWIFSKDGTVTNEDGERGIYRRIAKIIKEHAFQGWRLVTMYSNEIGKNALAVGGVGANSTMCEDILLFERCIKAENS